MAYEQTFAALADPTRRRVFEKLSSGPKSVGAIARGLPVSRPAVSQHLRVLKDAGLVADHAEGTRRVYSIDPHGLGAVAQVARSILGRGVARLCRRGRKIGEDAPMNRMNRTIEPAPVRKSVRVGAPPDRAFQVFTAGVGRWWPKSHHIGASDLDAVVIEPKAGGRWYERGIDGAECEVGKVLVWEPPARLVLCWQLTADWKFDPNLVTEVEVRFIPDGANATRVELEHRNLERFGDRADTVRQLIDAPEGWGGLLQLFKQAAEHSEE